MWLLSRIWTIQLKNRLYSQELTGQTNFIVAQQSWVKESWYWGVSPLTWSLGARIPLHLWLLTSPYYPLLLTQILQLAVILQTPLQVIRPPILQPQAIVLPIQLGIPPQVAIRLRIQRLTALEAETQPIQHRIRLEAEIIQLIVPQIAQEIILQIIIVQTVLTLQMVLIQWMTHRHLAMKHGTTMGQ